MPKWFSLVEDILTNLKDYTEKPVGKQENKQKEGSQAINR